MLALVVAGALGPSVVSLNTNKSSSSSSSSSKLLVSLLLVSIHTLLSALDLPLSLHSMLPRLAAPTPKHFGY